MEKVNLDVKNKAGKTEVTGSIDQVSRECVDNKTPSIKNGVEVLISLEPYGYKFSNLKIVSYREGNDQQQLVKAIINDIEVIKAAFLDRVEELLN